MEIKKEETWCSAYLFEYSKRYYFKGAEVGGELKKASRVANESNSGLPTLSNRVASVSSAGVSVAGADTRPQAGFILATLEACIILDSKINCTVAELAGLTLVPRHLSGLPLVNFAGYCMRGNIDPLTVAISLVMTASRTQNELYGPISRIIEYDENHKDLTLLIKDPYGLPVCVAIQAENFVRRKLRSTLKDCVKNELIKPLFDISDKEIEERLVNDLMTISTFNPSLAHFIFSLSDIAMVETIVGRFSGSKTVRTVLTQSGEEITETQF